MPDYITLLGAEEVKRAADTMSDAADRMSRAANLVEESNERLIRAMQEHADRIEEAMKERP